MRENRAFSVQSKLGPYVLSGGPFGLEIPWLWVRISAGQGFKRKAVYTGGASPVCKCTGQCTLEGSVQGGG